MNQIEANTIFDETLYHVESKVIVAIDCKWSDLKEDEIMLLGKILSSVRLSLEGVKIVSAPVNLELIVETYHPGIMLCFGEIAGVEGKPYEPSKFKDASILVSDSLSELTDDKKKALWGALKQMFSAQS